WQLALTLIIGLCIGTIINSGGIFITQIAVQSVYVVVVPATSTTMPFPRTLDALTGSMCAILLAFLIPRDARKVPRRLAADMPEQSGSRLRICSGAPTTSPRDHGHAAEVTRLSRARTFTDRAMRAMRVMARRLVGMPEPGVEKPVIVDYAGSLADGAKKLEIA